MLKATMGIIMALPIKRTASFRKQQQDVRRKRWQEKQASSIKTAKPEQNMTGHVCTGFSNVANRNGEGAAKATNASARPLRTAQIRISGHC
ncbi:hypothetical protein [uncultured Cohaesibacter sp.]|uniref:hypothetical protein n=1 Tax=uncultured Cohaesibacter sp. TaxID=1002546 RepID=UPI0029C95B81|nr:hypothetical protein [uncultured Cohaesibacter sp.]